MNENIEVLEEVLDVLEEEKRKFYSLINQNEFRIEEINSYLKELSKKEDEDFKVFSPRNVENVHRERIEAETSEMNKYENENKEYHKKIEFLKELIDKVNIVIRNLQCHNKEKIQISNEKYVVENRRIEKPEDNHNSEVDSEIGMKDIVDKYKKTENLDVQNDIIETENKFDFQEKRHVAHQILNCVSYITPDAERAKIELTALSKKLME